MSELDLDKTVTGTSPGTYCFECGLEKEWTPQDWTRRGFTDGPYNFKKSDYKVTETDKEIRVAPRVKTKVDVVVLHRALDLTDYEAGSYVVVKFVIESEKHVSMLRVSVVDGSVCEWKNTNRRGSSYQGHSDGDLLYLHFNQIEGALKTHKETDPLLLPRTFYEENIEDIKQALREYLEQ